MAEVFEVDLSAVDHASPTIDKLYKLLNKLYGSQKRVTKTTAKQIETLLQLNNTAKSSNTTVGTALRQLEKINNITNKQVRAEVELLKVKNQQKKAQLNDKSQHELFKNELKKETEILKDELRKREYLRKESDRKSQLTHYANRDYLKELHRQKLYNMDLRHVKSKYGTDTLNEYYENKHRRRMEEIKARGVYGGHGVMGSRLLSSNPFKLIDIISGGKLLNFVTKHIKPLAGITLVLSTFSKIGKHIGSEMKLATNLIVGFARNVYSIGKTLFSHITSISKSAIKSYQDYNLQKSRLDLIMRQRFSDSNSKSTANIISNISKNGVFKQADIMRGAMELATFVPDKNILNSLLEPLSNMVAEQYGYGATSQEWQSMADMLGRLYAGQTGALGRTGYTFTTEEKAILKGNDALAKRDLIIKSINMSVSKHNELLGKTIYGGILKQDNRLDDMLVKLGEVTIRFEALFKKLKADFVESILDKVIDKIKLVINNLDKIVLKVFNKINNALRNMQKWIPLITSGIATWLEAFMKIHGVAVLILRIIGNIFFKTNKAGEEMKSLSDTLASTFKNLAISIYDIVERLGGKMFKVLEKLGVVEKSDKAQLDYIQAKKDYERNLQGVKNLYNGRTDDDLRVNKYSKTLGEYRKILDEKTQRVKDLYEVESEFGIKPKYLGLKDIQTLGLETPETKRLKFISDMENYGKKTGQNLDDSIQWMKNLSEEIVDNLYKGKGAIDVNLVSLEGLPKEFLDYLKETAMNRFSVHLNSMTPQVTVNNTYNDSSEASHNDSVTKFVSALYTVSSARLVQ